MLNRSSRLNEGLYCMCIVQICEIYTVDILPCTYFGMWRAVTTPISVEELFFWKEKMLFVINLFKEFARYLAESDNGLDD